MTNGESRELAAAQREAARALQSLTDQIDRKPLIGVFERLVEVGQHRLPSPAATVRSMLTIETERLARTMPKGLRLGGSERALQSISGRSGAKAEQGPGRVVEVQSALDRATNEVRNLSRVLDSTNRAVEKNSRLLGEGLRSFLTGLLGGKRGGRLSILGSGFGLATLGLGIAGLFRRKQMALEPLTAFSLPPSVSLEVANTERILSGFARPVRDQMGKPRLEPQQSLSSGSPQIVVNISAMDSQSFMDRSGDIARAVRDAMLHMHPLNDVVSEI